jgi:hypothetical protein
MPRYYSYNEDAFRPSQVESDRVKSPKDQAIVSRSGAAPKGYYMAGTQTVSNKAGDKTYNIFRPLKIEETQPAEEAPVETAPAEEPQQQVQEQTGPDYGQQIADAMAAADARMADLMNQFKIQQAAAEERQRLAAEAQRQQRLTMARNERSAGRAPNLQIRGAGETPRTAGTQGFRRRRDQFRISPFQGIDGIMSSAGQIAQANQMVNI